MRSALSSARSRLPARLVLALSAVIAGQVSGCAPPPPPLIATIQQNAPKGKVVIVEFVDFECPFCRGSHLALAPVLRENEGHVVVIRKQVPLPFHPHAAPAARASVCAEAQGKEAEMADRLVVTLPGKLDDEGCAGLAEDLGLDMKAYVSCVVSASTEARIRNDVRDFAEAKLDSLPTMFIGGEKLEGEQSEATLRKAVKNARARL
jgi:protein-disulfide isomerase